MSKIDEIIERLDKAAERLKTVAQGRAFDVGTMVLYNGKLGVVVDLNKDATDPAGSTVDIRMDDGEVIEKVKVTNENLQRYRA